MPTEWLEASFDVDDGHHARELFATGYLFARRCLLSSIYMLNSRKGGEHKHNKIVSAPFVGV